MERSQKSQTCRLLLERKRRLGKASLYYFCKYILGFRDMELQPHWEVCNFIQTYAHLGDILLLLPRGTFKSSIMSVGYPIWRWIQNRDLRFLLSSIVQDNTIGFLGLISDHIKRNEDFRECYGNWDEGSRKEIWHREAISISGRTKYKVEASCTASSLKITKVSQHYDQGIFDDLQTDKNLSSREMVQEIENYIELMNPILDPQFKGSDLPGPKAIVGTRWHFDDVYGRLKAKELDRRNRGEPPRLRMMIREALDEKKNTVFFPARFTKEYLDNIASTMSRYHFSCQYLNNPIPDGDSIFKLSHLGWFWLDKNSSGNRFMNGNLSLMPHILNTFTTVDPSLGEHSDSDYTAIVTVGVDAEYNMYVLEVIREHLRGDDEIIDQLFEVWERWRPFRFGIETVAYQKSLQWGFEKRARETGRYFFIESLKTDSRISKDFRIRGFEPFVTGRKLYVRVCENTDLTQDQELLYHAALEGQNVLLDEMIRFPVGATKDVIDALSYMPQLVFPAGKEPKAPSPANSFERLMEKVVQRRGRAKVTLRPI